MNRHELRAFAKARQSKLAIGKLEAAKERAIEMRRSLSQMHQRAFAAENGLRSAREDGANAVLEAKYLPEMVKYIARELAATYGPEVVKHVDKLMAASRPRKSAELAAHFDDAVRGTTLRIEGVIPALYYTMAVRR